MTKMKKVESKKTYAIVFYFVLTIIFFVYHIHYDLSYGDAAEFFGLILRPGSPYMESTGNSIPLALFTFISERYQTWTSRYVIETVLVIFASIPKIFWHIADILMIILTAYSLDVLIDIKNTKVKYVCIFSLLMMYPTAHMCSAGWIATTTNYSWVVATGLYAMSVIKRIRNKEHTSKMTIILGGLACLYAANHEQMALLLSATIGAIIVTDFIEKKLSCGTVTYGIIVFAEFFSELFCPGNTARKGSEIIARAPEFNEYSVWDKFWRGFSSMMDYFLDKIDFLALTFFILTAYLIIKSDKKIIYKLISVFPIGYFVIRFIMLNSHIFSSAEKSRLFSFFSSPSESHEACFIAVCIAVSVIITCWQLMIGKKDGHIFLTAFLASVGTRIIMGFSPTMIASGERTLVYVLLGFGMVILYLVEQYEEDCSFLKKREFQVLLLTIDLIFVYVNFRHICKI